MTEEIKATVQYLTSMEVAKMVEKKHYNLLRDIKRYIGQAAQTKTDLTDFFMEASYTDKKGENRQYYHVTKKGCEFIAHKLTGVKGTAFTARYINRFHEMEEQAGAVNLDEETVRKMKDVVREQTELMCNMTSIIERQTRCLKDIKMEQAQAGMEKQPAGTERRARRAFGRNPFDETMGAFEKRRRTLNKLMNEVSEITGVDTMNLLSSLYRTIDRKYGVRMETRRERMEMETGKRCTAFDVLAYTDWLYERVENACHQIIEEHEQVI